MFIVKAAIMFSNGEIVEGRDYSSILRLAQKLGVARGEKIEGFLTSGDEFVLPSEATTIAKNAGQVEDNDTLTPEHLWNQEMVE